MRYYGTPVLDAIRTQMGDAIGGVSVMSKPEGHPIGWLDEDASNVKFPAVFLVPTGDFPDMPEVGEQGPGYVTQVYTTELYYVMRRGTSGNPWEAVRSKGEALATLLGPSDTTPYDADGWMNSADRFVEYAVTSVGIESDVQRWIREQRQPLASARVVLQFHLEVRYP